jgi:nucleoside-diphosphate-sugar epimerase
VSEYPQLLFEFVMPLFGQIKRNKEGKMDGIKKNNSALIVGITGGFGGYVARSLGARGWTLKALMRDPSRLPTDLQGVEVMQGDASIPEDMDRAMAGVAVVVYGANVPYPRWHTEALPMLEVTAAAAERHGVQILFPGNIYNYAPSSGPVLTEHTPQEATTKKGQIRVEMERRLERAAQNGARVLILRCGDFFGARAPSAWMNELIKPARGGRWKVVFPGPEALPHAFAYLPDVGEAAARLLERQEPAQPMEVFHFRGHQATLAQVGQAVEELVGSDKVSRGRLPWGLMALGAPFVPMVRELREMRYLWDVELALSNERLSAAIGPLPATPLGQALSATMGL